jgi:mannose-1-phosphate guanylyltransferase
MNINIPKDKTLAIVMGGGAGTRLFPLTEKRAKPSVPLGANTAWWTSRSATALTAVFV